MKKNGICIILLNTNKLIKKNVKFSDKEVQYSNLPEVMNTMV